MVFNISEELKKLPDKPGVYLMKNNEDIIYVGKARVLKNRVKQYFQKTNKSARIEKMVSLITSFEYIVTDSEVEALMLECNLIKLHSPKFNVMLKDDKTYPYIKITNEEYPIIYMTRKLLNDGGKYFGPYTDVFKVKSAIEYIKKMYPIRQCRKSSNRLKSVSRPCINYQMGRCLAPCSGNVSREEYMKMVNEVENILEGNISELVKKLEKQMEEYSNNYEFEKAAQIRDKISDVKSLIQKQKVSNFSENDIDVIGLYRNDTVCVQIFFVRNHKLIGRENYFFNNVEDLEDKEVVLEFMKQYYTSAVEIPSKIMVRYEVDDTGLLELLNQKKNMKVQIRTPKKGEKLRFIEMAEKNAKISLENMYKDVNKNKQALEELANLLELKDVPKYIESYDISNTSGHNIVGGMIVLENGNFKKNRYRKFKINDIFDQDDPKCMAQVLDRRLNKGINEKNEAFLPLPNLILLDGGITQINAVKEVLKKYNLNISLFGMIKNDKHTTKAILNDKNEELQLGNETLKNYVTNIQDEIHNFTIQYHRKIRDGKITKSILDDIPGIGIKKKQELLKKFGSVEKVLNASVEELTRVKGITKTIAEDITKQR